MSNQDIIPSEHVEHTQLLSARRYPDRGLFLGEWIPVRLIFILLFVAWGATALIAFLPISNVTVGYAAIVSVYAIAVIGSLHPHLSGIQRATLVTAPALLVALIVIDPVELGLFGYDPGLSMQALAVLQSEGVSAAIATNITYPAIHVLASVLIELLGLPPTPVAKYLPLTVAFTPVILFIALRRLLDDTYATMVAITFGSVRALLMFETKFIDESLAVTLFLTLILIVCVGNLGRMKFIGLPVAATLALSHHSFSILVGLFLLTWGAFEMVSGMTVFADRPNRLVPAAHLRNSKQLLSWSILIFLLSVTVVRFGSPEEFDQLAATVVLSTLSAQPSVTEGSVTTPVVGVRGAILRAAVPLLGVYALITVFGIFSKKRYPAWVYGWTGFGGITGVFFVIATALGRVLQLDPIRFYIPFCVSTVVAAAGVVRSVRSRVKLVESLFVLLTIAFIITQALALPPPVLFSDTGDVTPIEDHYARQQFAAGNWAGEYMNSTNIAGVERDVWYYGGVEFATTKETNPRCANWAVSRWTDVSSADFPEPPHVIYDNGPLSLERC